MGWILDNARAVGHGGGCGEGYQVPRSQTGEEMMGTALLTRRQMREARWVANWASLVTDLLLDPTLAHSIGRDLMRPGVQLALKKIYEEEALWAGSRKGV